MTKEAGDHIHLFWWDLLASGHVIELLIARLTFESGRNPVICVTIQMKPLLVELSKGAIYLSSNFV